MLSDSSRFSWQMSECISHMDISSMSRDPTFSFVSLANECFVRDSPERRNQLNIAAAHLPHACCLQINDIRTLNYELCIMQAPVSRKIHPQGQGCFALAFQHELRIDAGICGPCGSHGTLEPTTFKMARFENAASHWLKTPNAGRQRQRKLTIGVRN